MPFSVLYDWELWTVLLSCDGCEQVGNDIAASSDKNEVVGASV